MQLELRRIRSLNLERPTGPGRPLHLASASGLVRINDRFVVIGDDELSLGLFPLDSSLPGALLQVLPGELPADYKARKKQKPDFEAICLLPIKDAGITSAVCLPSGSKPNRTRGVVVDFDQNLNPQVSECDFKYLYLALLENFPDLNIEGAVFQNDRLLLFQRGNSKLLQNAVIELDGAEFVGQARRGAVTADVIKKIKSYDLGNLEGIPLSFTDAAASAEGTIYFLAAAEATDNTYDDGEFRGAVLGLLDAELNVNANVELEIRTKPEGLWLERSGKGETAYIVTDADDALVPSELFSLTLPF